MVKYGKNWTIKVLFWRSSRIGTINLGSKNVFPPPFCLLCGCAFPPVLTCLISYTIYLCSSAFTYIPWVSSRRTQTKAVWVLTWVHFLVLCFPPVLVLVLFLLYLEFNYLLPSANLYLTTLSALSLHLPFNYLQQHKKSPALCLWVSLKVNDSSFQILKCQVFQRQCKTPIRENTIKQCSESHSHPIFIFWGLMVVKLKKLLGALP